MVSAHSTASTEVRVKEAAVTLFGTYGFAATGIRDLAHEAGISVASLYHYMRTKEELLLSLMLDGIAKLLEPARAALDPGLGPEKHLVELVRVHIKFHCEEAALAKVTDTELRSLSPQARQRVTDLRDAYQKLWKDTVVRGNATGVFEASDAKMTVIALLEMCTGVSHWYSASGPYSVAEIEEIYVALALRLVGHSAPSDRSMPRPRTGNGGRSRT